MNLTLKARQMQQAAERYVRRTEERSRNLRIIRSGRWLSLDRPDRVSRWLLRRGFSADEASRLIAAHNADDQRAVLGAERYRVLERQIGQNNQMSVAFLEAGALAARTVGRMLVDVSFGAPAEYGTGFLVSPRLLLTNHHVLESPAVARNSAVEFGFEQDVAGRLRRGVVFRLQPDVLFLNDGTLDYALVAVEAVGADGARLVEQRWNPLLVEQAKSITGQWVNIIQHPGGGPKQLVLRENQIVDAFPDDSPDFLTYLADTAPGSSGSPVFNDRWEVVALHHAGVYRRDEEGRPMTHGGKVWDSAMGEDALDWEANEGVRITKIVGHLQAREMPAPQRALLAESFQRPPPPTPGAGGVTIETPASTPEAMNTTNARSVSLILPPEPCEITVRFGAPLGTTPSPLGTVGP
ncbi:MAG: trypsin-like peptidase domain-containing protein, partial [Phycisphaerales bacterium]|nr:trypsin-like peptidase domain-containing protein [Phycisphaerales bacterium]